MIAILKRHLSQFLTTTFYARWPERHHVEDGYTVLIPMPADMPFLLRCALEGLRHLQMPNCKQIIIIPDGTANDHALQTIVAENGDERVRIVTLARIDKMFLTIPRGAGSTNNCRHFTQILRGLFAATTDAIYLHDADAFWLEEGGIESQYREFRERGMYTLGVTSRIDPMFRKRGMNIPGTWELMFLSSWVRRRPPVELACGWHRLPGGEWHWFDTLDFGGYLDYASGKIGVMANPPRFVHFYGMITEYRLWQRAGRSQATEDKLFCLLLLSILAEVLPGAQNSIPLPHPHELARGLRDPSATITYLADSAPKRYASFRGGIEALRSCPVFANAAGRIGELLAPFDEHFSAPKLL